MFQLDIDLDYWFARGKMPINGTGADDFGVIASVGNIQVYHDQKHKTKYISSRDCSTKLLE
ncbi:hypothetical protein AM499_12930 [Bacillus sp. FJAT-22090]|uniref:hypothetical protein n=1 Tax=Bacillus sp. FJAT-22090 TaxID=1581038 RepID=UPI0006ADBCD9|nr:hypothetical protein [Bacillus sp. FJAT-22090]ALC86635.1 hypothetical protein AM499_12930 [Bacillus sp. FJAT-22090]